MQNIDGNGKIVYAYYMIGQMNKANLIFLAIVAVATFAVLELLKSHIGAPFAYGIGVALVAALAASLLRK